LKNLEKLEEHYQREVALAKKHKQNAEDLKREIEIFKGNLINQKIKALNFNGQEYKKLLELLNDKKGLMEAIEKVKGDDNLGTETQNLALHSSNSTDSSNSADSSVYAAEES